LEPSKHSGVSNVGYDDIGGLIIMCFATHCDNNGSACSSLFNYLIFALGESVNIKAFSGEIEMRNDINSVIFNKSAYLELSLQFNTT
jgi:hypothetical protein